MNIDSVDLNNATILQCEKCQGIGFKQTLLLHRISPLMSPTGQETIFPQPVFACEACGHVNEDFKQMTLEAPTQAP